MGRMHLLGLLETFRALFITAQAKDETIRALFIASQASGHALAVPPLPYERIQSVLHEICMKRKLKRTKDKSYTTGLTPFTVYEEAGMCIWWVTLHVP
eukprot:gene28014-31111_t